jgi:hypothetical protein
LDEAGLPAFEIGSLPKPEWRHMISEAQSRCQGVSEACPEDIRLYVAVTTAWILEMAAINISMHGVSSQKTIDFVQGVVGDESFLAVLAEEEAAKEASHELSVLSAKVA